MGVYVETLIRGSLEEVWRKTQEPEAHKRWDLRFSSIEYLPRWAEDEPQRFLYETRIGGGLRVRGEGVSKGGREGERGERISSLKFWSEDRKALIREGSGYWRYVPREDGGVRFLTWYDYRTRFGPFGRLVDLALFRPLMAWATAWSFDRLRLWIEEGVNPQAAARESAVYALARLATAGVWIYQGLVPKLLYAHEDERRMLRDGGVPDGAVRPALVLVGLAEVAFGSLLLFAWRARSLFLVNVLLMLLALAAVARNSPRHLVAAFNPVTVNALMVLISLAGYVAGEKLPSAGRCAWSADKGRPAEAGS